MGYRSFLRVCVVKSVNMADDPNRGKEVVTGSATYEGETLDGMKHGEGTLTWDDGDKFEGIFHKDEKVKGTFT